MTIPQQIIDEIISQAQREAPCEACGYLLGTSSETEGDVVAENYPIFPSFGRSSRKTHFVRKNAVSLTK